MTLLTLLQRTQDDEDRILSSAQFHQLSNVPPEIEWFANIDNPQTQRAYKNDISEFIYFTGIQKPEEFRIVTRAHVIAWRKTLEKRSLAGSTIRRKMAALSSLFDYLCERHAVDFNPVKGAKRPKIESYEGKTPPIGDEQARELLHAPDPATVQGKRDRAILSVFLYHGLRRDELCRLTVGDIHGRRGQVHLRIHGKGGKVRYMPLHPGTHILLKEYLKASGHGGDAACPLFLPMKDYIRPDDKRHGITPDGVYKLLRMYTAKANIDTFGVCLHSLRATAATNALDNKADIAKVQEWLGHAHISTTRIYDHRRNQPEESPTFKVNY